MTTAKSFKLSKVDVIFADGSKSDIRDLVGEFNWFESIDSPFIRCDFAILDSIQFDDNLLGSELIDITFESYAGTASDTSKTYNKRTKKEVIKHQLQIYKIGSVVKQERVKMYILHTASPEIYKNESERAFGQFGPASGRADIVERMLLKNLDAKKKKLFIEGYSKMNVLSPSWRPVDLISYISDKVVRTDASNKKKRSMQKGGNAQSGFLFFENRLGWNFLSMDYLCEQDPAITYIYAQSNVNDNSAAANAYTIENIKFPDRANQLEKLRLGVYKSVTHGISMSQSTDSHTTQPGASSSLQFDNYFRTLGDDYEPPATDELNSLSASQLQKLYNKEEKQENRFFTAGLDKSWSWEPQKTGKKGKRTDKQIEVDEKLGKPSGTVTGPHVSNIFSVFQKASTIHKGFPYEPDRAEAITKLHPTRTKFKILPTNINQTASAPNGGADQAPVNVIQAAAYSAARWSLLNTHTLTITVPGNTALYAGAIIKVKLPSSQQKGSKKVKRDEMYSGNYLIKGLRHLWKKDGITTELFLCRDSLPVSDK